MAAIKFSELPVNPAAQNLVGVFTSNGISTDVLVPNEIDGVTIQVVTPLDGGSVTSDGSEKMIINSAGSLANLTITFPASPNNGQLFGIFTFQSVSTVVLVPSGFIVNGPGSLAALTSLTWYWSSVMNNWIPW